MILRRIKSEAKKLLLSMSLTIQEVTDDEEITKLLSAKENCENFTLKIYPPIVVKYKGKICCAHRVGTSFPEDQDIASWVHSESNFHEELTPEACQRTIAILAGKNAKDIANGKSLASIKAKVEGKSFDWGDDDSNDEKLEKLLEAAV